MDRFRVHLARDSTEPGGDSSAPAKSPLIDEVSRVQTATAIDGPVP